MLTAFAIALMVLMAAFWPNLRVAQGVMTLHLQAITTNEAGLPRYLFVLTNNAYDCVAYYRVVLTHRDGCEPAFLTDFHLKFHRLRK